MHLQKSIRKTCYLNALYQKFSFKNEKLGTNLSRALYLFCLKCTFSHFIIEINILSR